ncbi:GTP-binding protein [Streptomyces albus]|uniref:GTP-binding protein n=1 Tax=Streptomyces albus TaxID=1888 RepID=UPI0036FDFCC5
MYRVKGILALVGEDRRCILQGLHRLHGLSEGAPWQRRHGAPVPGGCTIRTCRDWLVTSA